MIVTRYGANPNDAEVEQRMLDDADQRPGVTADSIRAAERDPIIVRAPQRVKAIPRA